MSVELNVKNVDIPYQQSIDGDAFPLAYCCESSGATKEATQDWIREQHSVIASQLNRHGAILFRGFPATTPEDFDWFVRTFDYPNFKYEESLSNAVRIVRTDRVFSANEAPADVEIFLHHEMAQTPIYPGKLFFFCEVAPDSGGATPLCRSDLLFAKMQEKLPKFAADADAKGLKYSNVMPAANDAMSGMGRSWQSTFGAEDVSGAERRMRELNYSWEWLSDGCLRATTPVLPAVRDLGDGRKAFFNQLIAAFRGWKDERNDPSKAITFGDGSILPRDDVMATTDLAEELTFDMNWQPGDVALVDNFSTMHARRPFVGKRKVWASLVAA